MSKTVLLTISTDPQDRGRSLVEGTPTLVDLLADSPTLDASPTLLTLFADLPEDDSEELLAALEKAAHVIAYQAAAYRKSTGRVHL